MLSSLQKRWRLADPPQETVDRLVRELNVTPTLARLLINRRVETADDARFFLENDLSRLHDPFLMKGMDAAAERVLRAIENREKITAFCDYDVDGVTSAAFLIHFFRDLGVEIDDYLPERLREGYGLNAQAIHEIHSRGTRLIITADCGITAVEEVRTARALGVDVIISDHHQVGPQGLPEAVAVLNPHRSDCTYPYRFLSGVGIALKLAQAVRSRLLAAGWDRERLPNLKRHLDLFALGTIADVAPLTGENHLLSALGLEVMTVSAKPGLIALKEVAGVTGAVTARSVGFGLGPRLNAAGRLGKADAGLHLLISPDLREAMELAAVLDRTNQERKDVQERVLEEAEYLMEREVNLEKDRVIVLASENFHPGVVGIAASRLVEKYFRPTVLIALEGEVGKGSGRSIPRFNLHKAFIECASHLVQFGGHAYAAGLTIRKDCVPHFRDAMNRVGERILQPEDLIPEMKIDAEISLEEIDLKFYRSLQQFEPCGPENPVPVFLLRNVSVSGARTMGAGGGHVRFQARQGSRSVDVVGFNLAAELFTLLETQDALDLAGEVALNDWNGQRKVEMRLLDLRPAAKTAPQAG